MKTLQNALLLQCVLCKNHYTLADVKNLEYFPSTGVCARCYRSMQNQPHQESCFGKKNVRSKNGKITKFGYDLNARECSRECVDRGICKLFIKLRRNHSGED